MSSTTLTRQKSVLSVDDSVLMHKLVQRYLSSDYRVWVAGNALDALNVVYHQDIDIMLLDVMMPGIDGLEFCRTIRSLPQFKTIPIIMVTSKNSAFDRVQGRMAGATEYLVKPFDSNQLRQIVQRLT